VISLSKAGQLRADRLLTNLGFCTRSDVLLWSRQHHLTINGQPLKKAGQWVNPDHILIEGKQIPYGYKPLTIVLHKPPGFVCSRALDHQQNNLVYELLPSSFFHRRPLMAVCGRLDKFATGLVCLTQNGRVGEQLTAPLPSAKITSLPILLQYLAKKNEILENSPGGATFDSIYDNRDDLLAQLIDKVLLEMDTLGKKKVYEIIATLPFSEKHVKFFGSGRVMLTGESVPCLPARLEIDEINPHKARLSLFEGKYHQLRRMLGSIQNKAESIHRVQVGPFTLDGLDVGLWRVATEDEMGNFEGLEKEPPHGGHRRKKKLQKIDAFSRKHLESKEQHYLE